MPQITVRQIRDEYPFLDERVATEPFIHDILKDIERTQREGYQRGSGGFASKDSIQSSRNIHIPFTPAREKNIEYILELLSSKYPDNVQAMITFDFRFDESQKKLGLVEKEEYSLNLSYAEHEALVAERDEISLGNFCKFIQSFRLFNLDKIVTRAKYKVDLNRVIRKGLGSQFFTYNHYVLDKGKIESSEEYCFHSVNYDHVKKSLNLGQLMGFVGTYSELVKSRLRKFGIMSMDFSDYRDTKIDYIISILIEDLGNSVQDKDRIEIKNFKSLRECILQVDKVLDPAQILSGDIVKHIRLGGIVSSNEIIANVMNTTPEIIGSWDSTERLTKEHLIKQCDPNGMNYYIDGYNLIPLFAASLNAVRNDTQSPLTVHQREFQNTRAEILYHASKETLRYSTAQDIIGGSDIDIVKLTHLIDEYEALIKKKMLTREMKKTAPVEQKPKSRSLVAVIISLFSSFFGLFGRSKDSEDEESEQSFDEYGQSAPTLAVKSEIRKETKDINEKANLRRSPLVPLSDLIEISGKNDDAIGKIVSELRDNNLKIVIPIYEAKSILYPKRSSKLLMSDVEYLLVPPHVIKSVESIAEFINSIIGIKLKDETIPARGISAIEKYLKILYRQRRASIIRKREDREKSMRGK